MPLILNSLLFFTINELYNENIQDCSYQDHDKSKEISRSTFKLMFLCFFTLKLTQ
jgi:hypothetical protein